MDIVTSLTVVIVAQYLCGSDHHVVYLNLIQCWVSFISEWSWGKSVLTVPKQPQWFAHYWCQMTLQLRWCIFHCLNVDLFLCCCDRYLLKGSSFFFNSKNRDLVNSMCSSWGWWNEKRGSQEEPINCQIFSNFFLMPSSSLVQCHYLSLYYRILRLKNNCPQLIFLPLTLTALPPSFSAHCSQSYLSKNNRITLLFFLLNVLHWLLRALRVRATSLP